MNGYHKFKDQYLGGSYVLQWKHLSSFLFLNNIKLVFFNSIKEGWVMYDEDPQSRLIKAEAILLETLSKLVWIVSILYGVELIIAVYDKSFDLWNRGDYNIIILALITLAVILKILGLVDKHLMEYWKRQDVKKR